jgi:transcriptional regulator with XRE-family HTH domain
VFAPLGQPHPSGFRKEVKSFFIKPTKGTTGNVIFADKPMNNTINDRVKQIRKTLGLTQAQFSRGIPLSGSHLAGIETGDRAVNERTVKLLGISYGVSETFLITGEGDMFDRSVDVRTEELTLTFKNLPRSFQDCLLRMARDLRKLAP